MTSDHAHTGLVQRVVVIGKGARWQESVGCPVTKADKGTCACHTGDNAIHHFALLAGEQGGGEPVNGATLGRCRAPLCLGDMSAVINKVESLPAAEPVSRRAAG